MPAIEPYRNYPFRLSWNDAVAAGVSAVSGMDSSPSPRNAPAIVTLRRGLNDNAPFQAWIKSPTPQPQDLYLAIINESGVQVTGYRLLRCLPSKFVAPDPFMIDGHMLIETLDLQNEGVVPDAPSS